MRTAICFSGQARSLQYTYLNLKEYLINQIKNCDVFIYIAEDESYYNNKCFIDYLEPIEICVKKDEYINDIGIKHQQRTGNVQEYLQMLTGWKKANQLRLEYEKKNNFIYDRVIRTRLDVKFFNPISNIDDYDLDYIYVPDFHSFACVQGKGQNDRFAISNSHNITVYSNMIDYIPQYVLENHILHAESTLYYHLNKQNMKIRLCSIKFTRVRKYGEEVDLIIRKNSSAWPEIQRGYLGD